VLANSGLWRVEPEAGNNPLNWSDFISAAGQFALVTAVSFVVLTVLASMIRFYQLQHPALLTPEDQISDATRFAAQIAARLGTAYRQPQPFCVLMASGPALADPERGAALLAALQAHVRRTDIVLRLDADTIGLLLDGPRRAIEGVIARLQTATMELGGVRLGVASCPENGVRAQPLQEAARAALPTTGLGWSFAAPLAATEFAQESATEEHGHDAWLDDLTGVLKPERLNRLMSKFVARYRREGSPVSMIYFDVDYLGRYNDHYGREAGDEVLRGIGKVLQHCLREGDLIGRTMGDGFIALLDTTPANALKVAQRLANEIKRATFTSGGFTLKVTVSGGVAGFPDHGRTSAVIHDAAHAALRAAQEGGRNQCLLFNPSMRSYQQLNRGPDEF